MVFKQFCPKLWRSVETPPPRERRNDQDLQARNGRKEGHPSSVACAGIKTIFLSLAPPSNLVDASQQIGGIVVDAERTGFVATRPAHSRRLRDLTPSAPTSYPAANMSQMLSPTTIAVSMGAFSRSRQRETGPGPAWHI